MAQRKVQLCIQEQTERDAAPGNCQKNSSQLKTISAVSRQHHQRIQLENEMKAE